MQSSEQLVIGHKKQHYRKYYITIDILQNIKFLSTKQVEITLQ